MSNVAYDLDTSGGLMPLIRALIKPPDEDINGQKTKKPQHPYYKRPGKGHNHDSCDACGEGGDLICCDRCPASFHLGCYDPPLDENDIPAGQWLCRECRAAETDKPPSSRSSRAQSPIDNKSDTEKKTKASRNVFASSAKSKEQDKKKDVENKPSPMEVLVKAAKIMNPKQFELPREMKVPCPFPGTDKEGSKNGTPSIVSVDAWGCVPLPAKMCYVCQGTCKMAPLLQCDYCPLLFHQDCLDPPLTALPTGRWMCPNHVEQYIDWKLVNSISCSERVALWDKFSGPVDQHAIKVDFIRHARTANPPFRMKVPVGVRGRVVVPGMVRYHYRHPPSLLPSRREHVRCTNVLKRLKAASDYDGTDEEDDERPKQMICMNMSCPKYTGQGSCPYDPPALRPVSEQDAADDLREISEPKIEGSSDSSDLSDSDFEYLTAAVKRPKMSFPQDKSPGKRCHRDKLELRCDEDAESLLAIIDEQLKKLDERLIKLLAWQRLQQVLIGEQCGGEWRRAPMSSRAEALVVRSIDRGRLARHGFRHVAMPSELLGRRERESIARAVYGSPPAPSPPPSPAHSLSDAVVRATLCSVQRPATNGLGDGLGRPVPMRRARLAVGSRGGCDLLLDPTLCANVSPTHAIIFFDEVTRQFELINYSEWGTRVNGALYACDVSRPVVEPDDDGSPARALRTVLGYRLQTPRANGSLSSYSGRCQCPPPAPPSAAWEGSALLTHGALLQFGCLMYVFSITDARAFPYEESAPTEPAI